MALTQVSSEGIKDAQVKTADILDANITTAKIADDAVTSAKIPALAIGTSEIAVGAVSTNRLAVQDGNVDFNDSGKIRLGTGNDLEIYHSSDVSRIRNTNDSGTLKLQATSNGENAINIVPNGTVELFHNGIKKFWTRDGGVQVTGYVVADSYYLGDSEKFYFGNGNDLQIYHDGTDSHIYHSTAYPYNDLKIRASADIKLQTNNTEDAVVCNVNGAVEFYYDNSKKFETTSAGVTVTGSLLTSGNIDAGTANFLTDDNGIFSAGTAGDLQIYHNGSNTYLANSTGLFQLKNTAGNIDLLSWNDTLLRVNAGEMAVDCSANGSVDLYCDDVKKLETTSNGVTITSTTSAHGLYLTNGDAYNQIGFNANRSGASQSLGYMVGKWNTADVASISFVTGADTTNKDDGAIQFYTRASGGGMTQRMYIDPDGHVRIGNVSDLAHTGADDLIVGGNTNGVNHGITVFSHTGGDGRFCFADAGDEDGGMIKYVHASDYMQFYANGAERLRLDSNGDVEIDAAIGAGLSGKFVVKHGGTNPPAALFMSDSTSYQGTTLQSNCNRNTTNNTYSHFKCSIHGVADKMFVMDSGNVKNTHNSYGAISDVSLKENIVDAGSQWDDIKNIRIRKFNFKEATDPGKPTLLGVIAQEAEVVCPNLVESDVSMQEGVTKEYKSFKYSVLYMKAIKALQEAMAKIETLETKVAALEAG